MNPLRALIWKEGRESSYKIAVGACLGLFIGLNHDDSDFLSHLVGVLGAVLMGMDAVAGERSRGTLPFLFIRPLDRGWLLGVKFMVGAVGLLVVLAAYWAGVYIGLSEGDNPQFLWGFFWDPIDLDLEAILVDVGYGRLLLLWFFFYLILYTVVFLASTFSDSSPKAAIIGPMVVWVGVFFGGFIVLNTWGPISWYYTELVFLTDFESEAGILRPAFEPSLLLARAAVAALLAAGVLLWTRRTFRALASRYFQWTMGVLFLVSFGVTAIGEIDIKAHRERALIESVGHLPYEAPVVDLALQDRLAVVLLERGVSVVDVADWRAPRERGRVEIEGWRLWRLALSGSTAYVWGSAMAQDSVGVAVFDLSQPERPQLRVQRFLYPIVETGSTPLLMHTPRLVGWAAWEGYLYAGLLGSEWLELHSFDVRGGSLPQPVHVLPVAERVKHVWNSNWEMRWAGPHTFLTLGHDFVVLDLTDPRRPEELSRTPLRRFGLSKQYEESIEKLYHQLAPGMLPESVSLQLELKNPELLEVLERRQYGAYGENLYRIAVSPGLGPISLSGDKAYVQRYWPEELAVLDIRDLRRPVEVEYVPDKYFPLGLVIHGDIAYVRERRYKIDAYSVTDYGVLLRRAKLRFEVHRVHKPYDPTPYLAPESNNLVLAGDHICAILKNNLVVFETLRDD
ncbi:MAG: ABC transporter permease subunit [Gemmatimonadota bacterium]|nr:ABC transporter permease subunit [Gemmatimonadota bacterium]